MIPPRLSGAIDTCTIDNCTIGLRDPPSARDAVSPTPVGPVSVAVAASPGS